MHDKMIHKDEFRLRILLTNECNKDCSFCLNDFQPKEPVDYISILEVVDCLRAYGSFMSFTKEKSVVTFSGGEPGLHPSLKWILKVAKYYCETVKVVTNGLALRPELVPFVDVWHVGVTNKNPEVVDFLRYTENIVVQIVVRDDSTIIPLVDLISFYRKEGITVKLFIDFTSNFKTRIEEKIKYLMEFFHSGICTRFTGKQINRGVGCRDCEQECVTLKALWVFPNGESSTCPQRAYRFNSDSWDEIMELAYKAHRYVEPLLPEVTLKGE